jgi:putative glutathione S-transferase
LSEDPEHIYLRHPKGESVEDYQTEISTTIWNSPDRSVRANKNFKLSVDASINPLKGLLKNE